jgi:hypothetical protein
LLRIENRRRKIREATEESTSFGLMMMMNRGIRRLDATSSHLVKMRKIHKQEKGRKNQKFGQKTKRSKNQVTLNSILGPCKEHYLSYTLVFIRVETK